MELVCFSIFELANKVSHPLEISTELKKLRGKHDFSLHNYHSMSEIKDSTKSDVVAKKNTHYNVKQNLVNIALKTK
ncbi:hypothetical protein [Chryseobacterium sp. HMWF035]|uniref:hypothetical protein n=1 Tax=Chryseobacterium sp. HMWF035 TaxID=2056868 RepID=UPI000D33BACA|nr:hypothetical protein [Chryseobacterium sp. HMWF035]PTT66821.1 hypothetical protein DBR25_21935 [Chryseobacterium sp. HMWF001]PVV52705.1 hypothetical protein DD829_19385 [Chryseobacterium sp. HMWF035]